MSQPRDYDGFHDAFRAVERGFIPSRISTATTGSHYSVDTRVSNFDALIDSIQLYSDDFEDQAETITRITSTSESIVFQDSQYDPRTPVTARSTTIHQRTPTQSVPQTPKTDRMSFTSEFEPSHGLPSYAEDAQKKMRRRNRLSALSTTSQFQDDGSEESDEQAPVDGEIPKRFDHRRTPPLHILQQQWLAARMPSHSSVDQQDRMLRSARSELDVRPTQHKQDSTGIRLTTMTEYLTGAKDPFAREAPPAPAVPPMPPHLLSPPPRRRTSCKAFPIPSSPLSQEAMAATSTSGSSSPAVSTGSSPGATPSTLGTASLNTSESSADSVATLAQLNPAQICGLELTISTKDGRQISLPLHLTGIPRSISQPNLHVAAEETLKPHTTILHNVSPKKSAGLLRRFQIPPLFRKKVSFDATTQYS